MDMVFLCLGLIHVALVPCKVTALVLILELSMLLILHLG